MTSWFWNKFKENCHFSSTFPGFLTIFKAQSKFQHFSSKGLKFQHFSRGYAPCHGQGQIWLSLRPSVHSICLLLILWQSNHLWLRYSKFQIWSWKFKVKVMDKVKSYGHIWGLEFNRYVCFLFRGNRTIFGWDIANSIFDLENSRSMSRPKSNPMVIFEAQSSIDMFAFCFVAIGPLLAEKQCIPYLTLKN